MTHVRVSDLTVEYTRGDYVVRPLDALSFDVEDGELVALLGPSGSGKTTLLSCLGGILAPTAGTIDVGGMSVADLGGDALATYRRSQVGIVFQAFNLLAALTARDNVAAPLWLAGMSRRDAAACADRLLGQVGLGDRTHHRPAMLSGGQQQRVAIARALVHDPPVLLADEPTAHLDYIQVEGILDLIRKLASPGRVVIVATHDERIAPLADRVIELAPGPAPSDAPHEVRADRGSLVFEQGSRGHLVYFVDEGEVEIVRMRADGGEEVLATVGRGGYFGELGPALRLPRTATARVRQASVLTAMGLPEFRARQSGHGARV